MIYSVIILILCYFNSIKVQLELFVDVYFIIIIYFNSIKVQLEPKSRFNKGSSTVFQFHKGTIRTLPPQYPGNMIIKFQFHKGTIRTRTQFN